MSTTVKPLTQEEAMDFAERNKVVNRLTPEDLNKLKDMGWEVAYDYSIERKYKDYYLVIEFCIGDFCTSICSKKGHYLLEAKVAVPTLMDAMLQQAKNINRIESGEHWQGEEN